MLTRLILLFVAVPLVEFALLMQLAGWIGLLPTLALVVATGAAGAALARRQGLRALAGVRSELESGRLPGRSLLDGLSVLIGGAFLLTPGILTDAAGFSLLIPFTRRRLQQVAKRLLERRLTEGVEVRVSSPGGGFTTVRGEVGTRDPEFRDPS